MSHFDSATSTNLATSIDQHSTRIQSSSSSRSHFRLPSSLPKLQLFILCLVRLCEPISFTVIFPMVAFMVAEFNPSLSDKQVGFYCGAIESIFSLAQLFTIILWGKLSDRIGRKPVILIGLIGVSISTLSFGFSKNFWWMMASRSIAGALNGNAAVIKSMVGEITTPDNQALAFSFLPSSFAIGSIVGPLLGGYLSRPSERFPNSWFADSPFWQNHPWLLPCSIASVAPLVGIVIASIWLEETLVYKSSTSLERQPLLQSELDDQQGSTNPDYGAIPSARPSTDIISLLKDHNLLTLLTSYSLLSFQTISLEALIVLFAFTPIKSGGIGFSTADIGLALSISGALTILAQVVLFPPLQRVFGTASLYKLCMSSYPLIFVMFPIVHFIARHENNENHDATEGFSNSFRVWIGIWIILILKTSANMVFSCNMLLVNAVAPTRDVLGTINGLAQCCASFVRAVGPITASSLFAVSVLHQNVVDGTLVFFLFSLFALVGFLNSLNVKDGEERWRNV